MISNNNTVLWAEDEAFHMGLVRVVMKEYYDDLFLAEAKDGSEALSFLDDALLLNELPRLIVLDINMPEMDGRKTLINIITRPELTNTPKVLFSNSNSLLDKLFCRRYNVPLIFKAYNEMDCKEAITNILDTFIGIKKSAF